jgi:hypothetical protein
VGANLNIPDELGGAAVRDWISFSEIMGKIYEQLYSPAALARSPEERAESARQLIQAMGMYWTLPAKSLPVWVLRKAPADMM